MDVMFDTVEEARKVCTDYEQMDGYVVGHIQTRDEFQRLFDNFHVE